MTIQLERELEGVALTEDDRPLVLLDVDGVVNDWSVPTDVGSQLSAISAGALKVMGRPAALIQPQTVEAVQLLVDAADEVLWCSSWRHEANRLLPALLRDDQMPHTRTWGVITDDGGSYFTDRDIRWKPKAVAEDVRVLAAVEMGRPVLWVEDFGWGTRRWVHFGQSEILEGVTPIDVLPDPYLTKAHLDGWL